MFAIIENGSRQHRVTSGDTLQIDYQADAQAGGEVSFDRVLLANAGAASVVGKPYIEGASVTAQVVNPQHKGKKIEIGIYRRRKNSRKHVGHRQKYTIVRITNIDVPGLQVAAAENGSADK
ncbi:MAG TPA: 50S ribosomal protein L21 [Planctomycetaceae bacterium]|nr:50S ribosomal protein L21 [Planctomycetaceae bacterium]